MFFVGIGTPFFEYMATCAVIKKMELPFIFDPQNPRPIQGLVGLAPYSIEAPSTRYHGGLQPINQVASGSFRKGPSDSPKKKRQGELEPLRVDEGFDMSSWWWQPRVCWKKYTPVI